MQQIHIGSKGTSITFPAGSMNRAVRRKFSRLRRQGLSLEVAKAIAFRCR